MCPHHSKSLVQCFLCVDIPGAIITGSNLLCALQYVVWAAPNMSQPLQTWKRGILITAPLAVCSCCGVSSATEAHWDEDKIRRYIRPFEESFISRTLCWEPHYFTMHEWNGLFDAIKHRSLWNLKKTTNKRWGYWELHGIPQQHGPLAVMHPMVPCMIWGKADHSLGLPREDWENNDQWHSWWPAMCNPWTYCGADGQALWAMCADNACTGSRPWKVHRTRVYVITDDIAPERLASTVEISEITSDTCSEPADVTSKDDNGSSDSSWTFPALPDVGSVAGDGLCTASVASDTSAAPPEVETSVCTPNSTTIVDCQSGSQWELVD